MTSAHDPGQPAIAANAPSSARQRWGSSLGRYSPQRRRPMVGLALAGADAVVVEVPVAWPAPARSAGVAPVPPGRRPQCPVYPRPDWRWGGLPSRQPAASRPPQGCATSPLLLSVTAVRARVATSSADTPAAMPRIQPPIGPGPHGHLLPASRSPPSKPGARSCTTSDLGYPRPRRPRRGWTPRSRPPYCLPGVSATTLPMRCSPIDATRSWRSHGAHPRSRPPVQARSHAAHGRFRIDLRCRRPRYGASRLSAARLSPDTSQSRGARTAPSRRKGPRRPDNDVVTPAAGFLHSGQSGLDHP